MMNIILGGCGPGLWDTPVAINSFNSPVNIYMSEQENTFKCEYGDISSHAYSHLIYTWSCCEDYEHDDLW